MKTPPYDGKIKKGTLKRSVTQNERSGWVRPNRVVQIGQIGRQKTAKLGGKNQPNRVAECWEEHRCEISAGCHINLCHGGSGLNLVFEIESV